MKNRNPDNSNPDKPINQRLLARYASTRPKVIARLVRAASYMQGGLPGQEIALTDSNLLALYEQCIGERCENRNVGVHSVRVLRNYLIARRYI